MVDSVPILVTFTIYRQPPSLNKLIALRNAAQYRHTKRGRYLAGASLSGMRKSWASEMPWIPESDWANGKRYVRFTRVMGPGERPYDDDNLIGGLKAVRDALVDMHFITGDGPNSAEFSYHQRHGSLSALVIDVSVEPISAS